MKILVLLVCTSIGIGAVTQLFLASEKIIHYQNRFIRRFPPHIAQEISQTDLKFNSYYFAGHGNGKIYLGNITAPLRILTLDMALNEDRVYSIELMEKDLAFSAPQIRIYKNNFYVFEGHVPYVYKGSIHNWIASKRKNSGYYFAHFEPMDSVEMITRYIMPKSGENLIGSLNLRDTTEVLYGPHLLEKQFDGVFDTDGSLHFNRKLQRVVYVYRYRNEYVVTHKNLELDYRGNTIDTISIAQVKLVRLKNSTRRTFAEPPLVVNKTSTVDGNLLYVNSGLPGNYEDKNLWKTASIVDVYDLTDGTYRSSFPIYNIKGETMKSMLVVGQFLYALIGDKIVSYKLLEPINQDKKASEYSGLGDG